MIKIQTNQPIFRCIPEYFQGERCYVLEKRIKFLFLEWWGKYNYWFPRESARFKTLKEAQEAVEFLSKKFYFNIDNYESTRKSRRKANRSTEETD